MVCALAKPQLIIVMLVDEVIDGIEIDIAGLEPKDLPALRALCDKHGFLISAL
jgi:hypothetical protein